MYKESVADVYKRQAHNIENAKAYVEMGRQHAEL